jgi:hypothetical protein
MCKYHGVFSIWLIPIAYSYLGSAVPSLVIDYLSSKIELFVDMVAHLVYLDAVKKRTLYFLTILYGGGPPRQPRDFRTAPRCRTEFRA